MISNLLRLNLTGSRRRQYRSPLQSAREGKRGNGMDLEDLRTTWEKLGRRDPFWAVLTLRRCKHNRWEPEAFFETGRREVEEALAYVRGLGVELRFGRALDFGCGVGRLCRALGERFDEVVGVDIAASMLDVARQHNRPVAREVVESFIAAAGAELIDVAPDASAGPGWESYRYCAVASVGRIRGVRPVFRVSRDGLRLILL